MKTRKEIRRSNLRAGQTGIPAWGVVQRPGVSTPADAVSHGDVARKRPIQIGAMSMGEVEIVSGLEEGESIVISSVEEFAGAEEERLVD